MLRLILFDTVFIDFQILFTSFLSVKPKFHWKNQRLNEETVSFHKTLLDSQKHDVILFVEKLFKC